MSKLNDMKICDIIKETELIMKYGDIAYYAKDDNTIKELFKLQDKKDFSSEQLKQFFIDHEDSIDKEKMVLILVRNYLLNIQMLLEELEELKEARDIEQMEEKISTQMLINKQKENLKKAMKLGKGMNKIITIYDYDKKSKQYVVDIIDSYELIDGKTRNEKNKLNRISELYSKLVLVNDENKDNGIYYMLRNISITDFIEIFPDREFGINIFRKVIQNKVLQDGQKTLEELEKINQNSAEFCEFMAEEESSINIHELNRTILDNIKYIDIDKLIMIASYRINEKFESEEVSKEENEKAKEVLKILYNSIKDDKKTIKFEKFFEENKEAVFEKIKYSKDDIKKCINQFTSKGYLTKKLMQEYKNKVSSGEIELSEIDSEYVEIIFSKKDLEKIAYFNIKNLKYISEKLGWNKEKIIEVIKNSNNCSIEILNTLINDKNISPNEIIELYMQGIIEINQITEIIDKIDLSKNITTQQLNEYYNNKEYEEFFDKYLELYKTVQIKEEKDITTCSNQLMEHIVEEYDIDKKEEHINKIEEYYKKGLITLNSLLEWEDEKIITKLYEDKIITLDDIQQLVKDKKLPFNYIEEKYNEIVENIDINYEERLKYIHSGCISTDEIIKLYQNNLIFENDFKDLVKIGIMSQEKIESIIKYRNKKELESKSSIVLGNLNRLSKRKNDIYDNEEQIKPNNKINTKPKLIIDPNEREEFINLFNAYKADAMLDETNPFYNYEFYVIPDESGDIGLNSVVIAERYYEDKNIEEKFATNNATYFFKYKDLMVLSNLNKREMTNVRDNIVFRANHVNATNKRCGHWAAGIIYGITKTMLSSDLKEYSPENKRKIILQKLSKLYNDNEIMEILNRAEQIDIGEYTCEIVESVNEER